jgi:hypothetical protein
MPGRVPGILHLPCGIHLPAIDRAQVENTVAFAEMVTVGEILRGVDIPE